MIKPLPTNPSRDVLVSTMQLLVEHVNRLSVQHWSQWQGLQQVEYLAALHDPAQPASPPAAPPTEEPSPNETEHAPAARPAHGRDH